MKNKAPRVGTIRYFDPVLFDQCADCGGLTKGQQVRVIQPHGCPKNGTMGMTYVESVDGQVKLAMVCINSLSKEAPAPDPSPSPS